MRSSFGAGGGVANGTEGDDVAGGRQAPNRLSTSRRASSRVTAPTTAMIVVSGRMRSRWKPTTSSRVSRATDSSVPSAGRPYGCPGYTSFVNAFDATASGLSSDCLISAWIWASLRLNSASGNDGERMTSWSRSSPSGTSFFSTDSDADIPSRPAPASRLPPTNSILASSSGPVRLAVPRVRSLPVRFASPSLPGGSITAPARVYRRVMTIGTAGRSLTSSTIPLGSTSRWAPGFAAGATETTSTARSSVIGSSRRNSIEPIIRAPSGLREQDSHARVPWLEVRAGHARDVVRSDGADLLEVIVLHLVPAGHLEATDQRRAPVNR